MSATETPSARWELGSEFSWCELPDAPLLSWPKDARWYLLGRHAVAALLQCHSQAKPRLWLPSYFCGEVAESCQQYCELSEYRDDPRWPQPDWASLRPTKEDFVVAVNYFGVRSPESWCEWRAHNECFLLEDHSQDPFSSWCFGSNADYAFASLRKTLPIPDGGLLWSPRGLRLPEQLGQDDGDWTGSALKMAAMFHKTNYLHGKGTVDLKPCFRDLQLRGEQRLRRARTSSISPYSYAYIAQGVPEVWRKQRLNNVRHLLKRLEDLTFATPLFNSWPDGAVPFAFPLIFGSRKERDECQAYMQRHKMYCPVHWACQTSDAQALDLSSRILSLPVDQRYGREEMDRLADTLLGFQEDQPNRKPERHESPVQSDPGPVSVSDSAPAVEMRPVLLSDRENFLAMAQQFFLDLNPNFVPHPDWKQHYFDNILRNPCWFPRWIIVDGHCAGYILFGLEDHRFLPRKTGTVYAIYIQPEFRRKGIARVCAEQAIRELQAQSPSKIDLEIMEDNQSAIAFWESLGFEKVSGRFVLRNVAQ